MNTLWNMGENDFQFMYEYDETRIVGILLSECWLKTSII